MKGNLLKNKTMWIGGMEGSSKKEKRRKLTDTDNSVVIVGDRVEGAEGVGG